MAGAIAPLADTGARVAAGELIAGLGLRDGGRPGDRPRVVAAMIGSADGRAAVAGRSVGLGHPADRAVLRSLRAGADAVLVGAATVRAERYADLFDGAAGPPIAIVTRSGDVPWEVGLFAEAQTRVAVYSDVPVAVPPHVRAAVTVRATAEPAAVLADLAEREGASLVMCEGGPRLLRALVAAGLLDDLVLTVAPLLVAGDGPSPLAGAELEPPARMTLRAVWRADDHAFLHYAA
jgi:riboflavin biosynthesis pyrimidine reductase